MPLVDICYYKFFLALWYDTSAMKRRFQPLCLEMIFQRASVCITIIRNSYGSETLVKTVILVLGDLKW